MKDLAEHLLAGRIGAQDRLIGILCAAAMDREPLTPQSLSALLEAQADAANKAGSPAEAAYLQARADSIKAAVR